MNYETDLEQHQDSGLTHREIADLLGIGRARVFFHEKEALKKLRRALEAAGIQSPMDFDAIPISRTGGGSPLEKGQVAAQTGRQFSSQHGWLTVNRIVSINDGSESVEDVVRAFRFLKARHEAIVRPPVIVKSHVNISYVIQATAEHEGNLKVRCWPEDGSPRTVSHLEKRRCTAIVESEFDADGDGEFDVPILMCVILS